MLTEAQHRKIRATMMLHGVTHDRVAAIGKVTVNYVTYVVTGRRKGYRIRRIIAAECGVPYEELWTDENDSELEAA